MLDSSQTIAACGDANEIFFVNEMIVAIFACFNMHSGDLAVAVEIVADGCAGLFANTGGRIGGEDHGIGVFNTTIFIMNKADGLLTQRVP